ncbi:hypothetical protein C2869_14895 [Saccharobesus litoralis]|uniref:YqcC-like domain-containing protein n=1 Tax=Saccharobesus litoralis TaxID=2172099 RepID=A0A2S0VTU7_9ALTE|nr:YqcC family protein [Saccharobesus litoralis]AWB67644.1 hypothetical protein C2869_14895 [Saccharobesus litoralis]
MPNPLQVKIILNELEQAMLNCGLWSITKPSKEALASTQPFCLDTLAFEQWLQFVLISRFHAMIDSGAPLPPNMKLMPIAEEAFKEYKQDLSKVMQVIQTLDNYFNES